MNLPLLLSVVLDAIDHPLALLDADLGVVKANIAFCRALDLIPAQTTGWKLDALGQGPLGTPRLREMLDQVLQAAGDPGPVEAGFDLHLSTQQKIRLNARRIVPQPGAAPLILVTLEGIPAGARSKAADREDARQRFQVLAEAAFEGIALTRKGVFVDLNEQLAEMLGYRREALLGTPVTGCVAEKDRQRVADHMASGSLDPYEHLALRKGGTVLPVEIHARRTGLGDTHTRITAIRDISARKKGEEALRMFRFAIEQASDAIFWMNRDAGFAYVNDQACRSLGYTREELMALHLWDIDPVFPKDRWAAEWAAYQKDRIGSQHHETLHRRKDGGVFPVEVSAKHIWVGDQELHLAFVRDITDHRRFEQELKRTQFALDRASIACFWMDPAGRFIYANDQACRSLGYTRDELMRKAAADIDPEMTSAQCRACWDQLRENRALRFETTHQRKDGAFFPVEITASLMQFDNQEYSCAFARDLTEQKKAESERGRLEAQLRQAQRIESVGRLAGGVAHDFNNMLSVILGYAELMKSAVADNDPLQAYILEIERAADHSRNVTRQLLAFSRKQIINPSPLDLNRLVSDTQKTLARLIGEDIDLRFYPGPDVWTIRFDPSQIEQVLINLAVNARDAMPAGGKLALETANVHLDDDDCRMHPGCIPGDFVMLGISDNGTGMAPETLAHVFEPFFTTKDVGKGTGLGLATVYGIVKQAGGFIDVYSEPDQGTVFKIYLPRMTAAEEIAPAPEAAAPVRGSGTVLLVEDDEMVRRMTTAMLEKIGYRVLVAPTPRAALALLENPDTPIALLMTDVVMPEMNGKELRIKANAIRPGMKVLFMSGYTANVIVHQGVLEEGVHFIQKPFNLNDLARKAREAIEGR